MSFRRKVAAVAACVTAALLGPVTAQATPTAGGYALTWSFESDAVASVPAGCTTPSGRAPVTVSADTAHYGVHSLLLADDSATSLPAVACARPAAKGADISFAVDPVAVPNGFMVDLLGTTTGGTHGVVFHLLFRGTGAVQWYDGSRWLMVAPAGGRLSDSGAPSRSRQPRTRTWPTCG